MFMADLYGASPSPSSDPEEMSFTFLHQLLHNSNHPSSSSSANPSASSKFSHHSFSSLHPPATGADMLDRIRFARSETEWVNFPDPRGYFSKDSAEKRKAAVSVENNDVGNASCEDREGEEVSEVPSNSEKPRSSSKRSRAAEVHNLSEKRRRSRINEKMKALQNLIPNSNKTDKAPMLDEAIEYLKQLQPQVQMLTMRNGLSLHPMCLPGVLQPMQLPLTGMSFDDGSALLNTNSVSGTYSANEGSSVQTTLNLPSQSAISNQPRTGTSTTDTSFGFEPPIHARHGTFNVATSSQVKLHLLIKFGTPDFLELRRTPYIFLECDGNLQGRYTTGTIRYESNWEDFFLWCLLVEILLLKTGLIK